MASFSLSTRVVSSRFTTLCHTSRVVCRHLAASSVQQSSHVERRSNSNKYDIVVIGGGIVGLGVARELILRYPNLKFAVVEKESRVGAHQSSKNSGVIHAGIYYQPGSLKARLCVEGLKLTYKYCDENNIPYKKCGKLIVATNAEEVSRLNNLLERGLKNEVPDLRVVGPKEIKDIEPHCVGQKALHSPHTGIVDFGEVTKSYCKNFQSLGGTVHLNFGVNKFEETTSDPDYPIAVIGKDPATQVVYAKYIIACGGLHSDRIAKMSGASAEPKIVPFRGEYLLLRPEKRHLARGNIYPVPDPRFPFLGVHFTPRMNGDVWLGPNAVLAFKREGYSLTQLDLNDLFDALGYKGLRKLVFSNLPYAFGELYRGINIAAQVEKLRRFIPELSVADVTRGPSGVRAQALASDGSLVDDFVFDSGRGALGPRMLHVRNAPSPAATSSLAIAKMVADKAKEQFKL